MNIETWLRILAVSLPLSGVLGLWRWPEKFTSVQRGLVVVIFSLSGFLAFTLFLLNRQYACVLRTGRQNCLVDGLATLSLILLNGILARESARLQGETRKGDTILMLLLSSAWAGMGLAKNLLVLLIFLYLFFYVLHKWLERNGLRLRFLIVRDDYSDEQIRYRDNRRNEGDRK